MFLSPYILLGMIINEVTGNNVSTVMRNRLWTPTGLHNTYLSREDEFPANMAHSWSDIYSDGVVEDITSVSRNTHDSIAWTAGGIFSTPEDLVKWFQALFHGSVINSSLLEQMQEFVLSPDFNAQGYGLGLCHFFSGFASGKEPVGHTGHNIGYMAI